MVYSKNLVTAIKVGGKVLRENKDIVTLPFGSEYSILLKNLNSVRVQVKVAVDGQDATEGTWLIIQPNASLELERFIRNGNFERGNRFKFIERTKQIEEHKGVGAEDGLIRVEFKTEKISLPRIHYYDKWVPVYHPYEPLSYRPYCWPYYDKYWDGGPATTPTVTCNNASTGSSNVTFSGNTLRSTGMRSSGVLMRPTRARASAKLNVQTSLNDAGITVAGSESNQKFVHALDFPTGQSEVIVLHLRGQVGGKKATKVVTVKSKPKCQTCGKANKGTMQFCGSCGTALSVI